MSTKIRIVLRLIATLRPFMPANEDESSCELVIPAGTSVADVIQDLGVPEAVLAGSAILINGRPGSADHVLSEGDRLTVFPAMAGG